MYGKLINGVLHTPPKDLVTTDDKVIIDFDANEELLKQMGYKLVTRNIPEYDPTTQKLILGSYIEEDNNIIINYIVATIPVDPKELIEKKFKELEDENEFLKNCLLEMSEIVYGS